MRPIPGTITDPAMDSLLRPAEPDPSRPVDDDGATMGGWATNQPYTPPAENLVRLSRRECAWLIEAALKHADRSGTPDFAPAIVEKLWACFKA